MVTSNALKNVLKLHDTLPLIDWFTPQMRSDFKSRSLTGNHTTAVQTAVDEIAAAGGGYEFTVGDGVVCLTSPVVMAAPMAS